MPHFHSTVSKHSGIEAQMSGAIRKWKLVKGFRHIFIKQAMKLRNETWMRYGRIRIAKMEIGIHMGFDQPIHITIRGISRPDIAHRVFHVDRMGGMSLDGVGIIALNVAHQGGNAPTRDRMQHRAKGDGFVKHVFRQVRSVGYRFR